MPTPEPELYYLKKEMNFSFKNESGVRLNSNATIK